MNQLHAVRALLVLLMLSAGFLVVHPANAPAADEYVGAQVCAGCHGDLANAYATSVHGRAGAKWTGYQGCESCHGPGADHASSSDPTKIRNPLKLSAKDLNEVCLGCHDRGKVALWMGSIHYARGLACTDCHSIHSGFKKYLKAGAEMDVCAKCHPDVRAEVWRSSHHPIREGKITCSDCHNPHGAIGKKLITASTVNEKCFECHAEKRGPFLYEHKPVVEDCTNCHVPHGSNHEKLLVRKVPWICQECHSSSRHPGTPYTLNNTQTGNVYQNVGLQGIYRACLNCHPNIHGSNHPSGVFFTR